MKKKILLRYSAGKATEPVLASIIKETGVLVNILYADFDTKGGVILISIDAPEQNVQRVLSALSNRGVDFEEVKRAVSVDQDACVDCGACVSLCPTGALKLDKGFSLKFDEDKCVLCEICVPACPMRAIKLREL